MERNVPAPQTKPDPQPPPEPSPEPQAEAQPKPEPQPEPAPGPEPQAQPDPQPESEPQPEPQATPEQEILPVPDEGWPGPSAEEVAAASSPRHYPWQEDAVFTLTIEALEIYDAPVLDSTSQEALNSGVVHIPETPMPWEGGQQKNVYLAGHRIGYPGTASRVLFYHLDRLSSGDAIVLEDRSGNAYRYRVSEMFVVEPDAGWVLDPVRNRDMVTLQTCTYPTFENRLIVRADRV